MVIEFDKLIKWLFSGVPIPLSENSVFLTDSLIMITLLRTTPGNAGYKEMVAKLDAELKITDGEDHAFYDQFNKSDQIKHAIVLFEGEMPIGCGALKEFHKEVMEIKRMFILKEKRGKGYASQILNELEVWAKELGFKTCILETGINQPEAIALYKKRGYHFIPNYGQYAGIEKSFCFKKDI
ncbi:hypothetical protein BH23BAC2_BH23BAC2_21370 [soil metagenome]